jgi:hypothetical protein
VLAVRLFIHNLMKYQLKQKAYEINFSKIDEGYLYSETICYAETIGQAKSILLKEIDLAKLKHSDEDISYLNIPVIRCKKADKFEFEGEDICLWRIEVILSERERKAKLDLLLNDDSLKFCYIKKGGYYRPNSCGYTDFRHRAGVYTKEEAVSHAKSCSDLTLIPIDIEEHNLMIQKEIDDLTTRVL